MTDSANPSPSEPSESATSESTSHLTHSQREESPLATGLKAGDRVRVAMLPPYVKTADTMPMLRPPTVLKVNEEGIIVNRRSADYWAVQFKGGTFLMEQQYLEKCPTADQ